MILYVLKAILIPFLGTSLGALGVFFLKNERKTETCALLRGFSAGMMTAASVWSLLIPSLELAKENGNIVCLPALVGLWCGAAFLTVCDGIAGQIERNDLSKDTRMLVWSVTLHNLPEGMAVGVSASGLLANDPYTTVSSVMALSIGIAVQNIPEGAIISLPLRAEGKSKGEAFFFGVLSGAIEPVGAILALFCVRFATLLLPYLLSFAAGAMLYAVTAELIPEMIGEKSRFSGIVSYFIGFSVMLALDTTL